MVLIALAVLTNVFGLLDSGEDTIRAYQLQPTEVDPDATAVVHLIPGETGTWFEFEIGGLDPSGDGDYYAVWLQRTADAAAVPLGSFQWEVSGELVRLSGPGRYDDYDLIVITETARDAQASAADTKVLVATID